MSEESTVCQAEPMNSEDMLFLLYTSGSTGKPKGIQHAQAGYLLYVNLTFEVSIDVCLAQFTKIIHSVNPFLCSVSLR